MYNKKSSQKKEKALHVITHQTLDRRRTQDQEVDRATLVVVLFDAMERWAARDCDRIGVKKSGFQEKRSGLSIWVPGKVWLQS